MSRRPPSQRNPEYAVQRMSRAIQSMAPGTMGGRAANASPIDFRSGATIPLVGSGGTGEGTATLPTRQEVVFTTGALTVGEIKQGVIDMASHYRLMYIKTSAPARVRLYFSVADRDRDLDRPITFDPYPGLGIVMDYLTADILLEAPLTPMAEGAVFGTTPGVSVPYNVTSVFGGSIIVTLTWIALE